ncbi:MAG TPA: peptidylprolyl isomerase, partial [Chloroflexota bacterium]|nr:peptidylprolyl isomerase [Chloroflexota bacterium]
DAEIATVDGRTITVEQFARYAGTRQGMIAKELAALQPQVQPTPAANATPTPPQLQTSQNVQILQQEQASLASSGPAEQVEGILVTEEAQKRGLTASQAEMDDALRYLLSAPQGDLSANYGLPILPSPMPTTGLVSLADAKSTLTQIDTNGKYLNQQQVEDEILKPVVLKTKLVAALGAGVKPVQDEVHARHILVADKATADTIEQKLKDGGDFAALAKQYSTDTGSKDNGGDLGWFGKGQMVAPFEQAAFSLQAGQISPPVQSQFGWHIIQVIAHDPNHQVDPRQLAQLRMQAYAAWLGPIQGDTTRVSFDAAANKLTWVSNYLTGS